MTNPALVILECDGVPESNTHLTSRRTPSSPTTGHGGVSVKATVKLNPTLVSTA
jgi:hypothetical protein